MILAYILTESDRDIEFVRILLPKKLSQDIQIIPTISSYRARSLASSPGETHLIS